MTHWFKNRFCNVSYTYILPQFWHWTRRKTTGCIRDSSVVLVRYVRYWITIHHCNVTGNHIKMYIHCNSCLSWNIRKYIKFFYVSHHRCRIYLYPKRTLAAWCKEVGSQTPSAFMFVHTRAWPSCGVTESPSSENNRVFITRWPLEDVVVISKWNFRTYFTDSVD